MNVLKFVNISYSRKISFNISLFIETLIIQ